MKLLTIDDALPCPFCGNENIKIRFKPSGWWVVDKPMRNATVGCLEYKGCGAIISRMGGLETTAENNAVAAWNRRTK